MKQILLIINIIAITVFANAQLPVETPKLGVSTTTATTIENPENVL